MNDSRGPVATRTPPYQPRHVTPSPQDDPALAADRERQSNLAVFATAVVVLLVLAGAAVVWFVPSDRGEITTAGWASPTAQSGTLPQTMTQDAPSVSVTPAGGAVATRAAGTPTPRASSAASPQQPAYPALAPRPGRRECGRSGSGPYAAVAADNARTSCPFTVNVHRAYQAAKLNGRTGTVKAYSPTTRKSYVMHCTGTQPAVCRGGRYAVVLLYGGQLRTR